MRSTNLHFTYLHIYSVILNSNNIQNGDILVPTYLGGPGQWPLNECHVVMMNVHCEGLQSSGRGSRNTTRHFSVVLGRVPREIHWCCCHGLNLILSMLSTQRTKRGSPTRFWMFLSSVCLRHFLKMIGKLFELALWTRSSADTDKLARCI